MPESLTYETLTGRQKIAIFLLAIGESFVKKIFEQFDDNEVREVSITMANLGNVDSALTQKVLEDFLDSFDKPRSLSGGFKRTEKLLQKVLPGLRQKNILDEMKGPAGRTVWDKLENVNADVLAGYLKNEYPQTGAVILSRLNPAYVAKVISFLPEDFAMDIIMRLLRLEHVKKDVLQEVEQTLHDDFMNTLAQSDGKEGHERIADVFNYLDRKTENRLMTALFERNRDVAEQVRSMMFTFEDIALLDSSSIQNVLRAVERQKMAIALKGVSDSVVEAFMNNLSPQARLILTEDMEALEAVRLRDVDQAQSDVVVIAKDLALKGDVILSQGEDIEEMIE